MLTSVYHYVCYLPHTTIEHGFSLGMSHDEPYCSSKYIMSASLGAGKTTWSSCSMRDFHKQITYLELVKSIYQDYN